MNLKTMVCLLLVFALMPNIVCAATSEEDESLDPFSPGNAKLAWDALDNNTKNTFMFIMGLVFLIVGSVIIFSFGGAAATYSAHKSGTFNDPEKKSSGASSMIAIIFIALGLILCIGFVKGLFGF